MLSTLLNTDMKTVEQRLLARTEYDEATECWNCTYSLGDWVYPQINIGRNNMLSTHRVAYQLWKGEIPKGLCVCHTCDNPKCINPEHLWVGTQQENLDDMYGKGRGPVGDKNGSRTHPEKRSRGDRNGSRTHPEKVPRGENNGMATITREQAIEIKQYIAQGCRNVDIATFMDVSVGVVRHIKYDNHWAHV